MDKLRIFGVPLIPWFVASLALIATALKLFDPVMAALALTAIISFGEAIAYSVLARGDKKHALAYRYIAGAQWLAAVVLLALCMEIFGWWTPPWFADGIILNHSSPMGRQIERLDHIGRLINSCRLRPASDKFRTK